MPICRKCQEKFDKTKDEEPKCPKCGSQTKSGDAFLHTEKAHKDWYNVKGKLGKQRGKPKRDMNTKNEKRK